MNQNDCKDQMRIRSSLADSSNLYFSLQVAFEGVGSMPMARIEGFREQKQEVVQIELRRRETRQQLQKAISGSDNSDHDVLSSRGTAPAAALRILVLNASKALSRLQHFNE